MKWIEMSDENLLQQKVLLEVDWAHSFIREISAVSPSYVLPDASIVAPDCLPSVRVFVSSQSTNAPGLELLFVEVDIFSAWFAGELNPEVNISNKGVMWKFTDTADAKIASRYLYYRFLTADTWGRGLRYGWEDVFNSAGELDIL